MSVVFVVAPVVACSWPIISAAVIAASAGLGYKAIQKAEADLAAGQQSNIAPQARSVQLVMQDSQIVADTLMRGESFAVQRDDVQATFRVDGRGQCSVHVSGEGKTDQELQTIGEELMDRVRQQFAYATVMAELSERGFQVVDQEVETNQSIRIRVRRN